MGIPEENTSEGGPSADASADRALSDEEVVTLPPVEQYRLTHNHGAIARSVARRDGSWVDSEISIGEVEIVNHDLGAAFDGAWLRSSKQPKLRGRRRVVRTVDLFSGCGGMSIGVAEACRALGMRMKPLLALDVDRTALEVYKRNFPVEYALSDPIEQLLDSDLGEPLSAREHWLKDTLGHVDILVGGPPCQGHSDLNNFTRRSDPKNKLYEKMARFAEVCEPDHIIVENVNGVRHDTGKVFEKTRDYLKSLDYHVDGHLLRAEVVGVPQSRPRVLLVASKLVSITVRGIATRYKTAPRNFMWACGDLVGVDPKAPFDRPATPAQITQERINYLFDNDLDVLPDHMRPRCHQKGHTYPSVYGRIRPFEPAPTMTTGFMTMGQGRFTHPTERRTLTAHEGARLQFFPDWFDFGPQSRQAYLRLIGNAVPSRFAYVVALEMLR